ncbi:hypothetical protein BR93DRAFT_645619 [Coniochaeta sp. PMI_546]|nr:hypothetical protein BR93DRAFT_645619 [Coniochaeta sp. PMI_546]
MSCQYLRLNTLGNRLSCQPGRLGGRLWKWKTCLQLVRCLFLVSQSMSMFVPADGRGDVSDEGKARFTSYKLSPAYEQTKVKSRKAVLPDALSFPSVSACLKKIEHGAHGGILSIVTLPW